MRWPGLLKGFDRLLALAKSQIAAAVVRLRKHPRENAGLAIYNLISLLSDNGDGLCSLSMTRMAELFGRTHKCVRETIDSLDEDGLLGVDRIGGLPSSYRPAVPTAIATMKPRAVWIIDAHSTTKKVENPEPRG